MEPVCRGNNAAAVRLGPDGVLRTSCINGIFDDALSLDRINSRSICKLKIVFVVFWEIFFFFWSFSFSSQSLCSRRLNCYKRSPMKWRTNCHPVPVRRNKNSIFYSPEISTNVFAMKLSNCSVVHCWLPFQESSPLRTIRFVVLAEVAFCTGDDDLLALAAVPVGFQWQSFLLVAVALVHYQPLLHKLNAKTKIHKLTFISSRPNEIYARANVEGIFFLRIYELY